jgi:hypothetical protein
VSANNKVFKLKLKSIKKEIMPPKKDYSKSNEAEFIGLIKAALQMKAL